MFIVIKSEHYDCTNLICKKDTLEEAVAAVKDSMAQRIHIMSDALFADKNSNTSNRQGAIVPRKSLPRTGPNAACA